MSKDKKLKTCNKKFKYFFMIIFVIIFIFSAIQIINYIMDGKENKKIIEEISQYIKIDTTNEIKEHDNITIDFNSLVEEKNSDIVGFLKVNGTDIGNVVVQAKDNIFYLTHNLEKNNNKAGWIFVDYKNKFDGTDKNIVIYGHNMKDGSMFGTLKNILNDDWLEKEENRYITFVTKNEEVIYEVFSVYKIENEDYYITTDFKDNESFQKFIDKVKSRSKKDFKVEVTKENQILTLSTCADNNKYRVVLHAKKTE